MASVGERLLQEGRELAKEAKGSDARCDRHHKLNVPHKPAVYGRQHVSSTI